MTTKASLIVTFILSMVFLPLSAQEPKTAKPGERGRLLSQVGQPLTKQDEKQLLARVWANPLIAAIRREHKLRVIRIYAGLGDPITSLAKYQKTSITAIIFDYETNKATRYVIDTASGNLVSEQVLSGRVQSSAEEIEAATNTIKGDPDLGKLLKGGTKVMGGFIVDGPTKSSPDHRFIQIRIVTADMNRTLKVVVVDLTSDSIASK